MDVIESNPHRGHCPYEGIKQVFSSIKATLKSTQKNNGSKTEGFNSLRGYWASSYYYPKLTVLFHFDKLVSTISQFTTTVKPLHHRN